MTMSTRKDIIVVLDESGSMLQMKDEVINSINNFVEKQKAGIADDGSTFTLWKFNYFVQKVIDDQNLHHVRYFNNYNPSDMTALYDAIGMAITTKLERENYKDVVCVIVTDGQENSSNLYTLDTIRTLITKMENDHNWKFAFLASNQDAFKSGNTIGVSSRRCAGYKHLPGRLSKIISDVSDTIMAYRVESSQAQDTDLTLEFLTLN